MGINAGANVAMAIGVGLIAGTANAAFVERAEPDGAAAISDSPRAAQAAAGLLGSSIAAFGGIALYGVGAAAGYRETMHGLLPGILGGALLGSAAGAVLAAIVD